jgi:hypothetical protein
MRCPLDCCRALGMKTWIAILAIGAGSIGWAVADGWESGIQWPTPHVVTPGEAPGAAPSDAVVLFDGTNLDAWDGGDQWKLKDGFAISDGGGISTKQGFGSCQLHLEFATPEKVEGSGQGRGNSGAYLMGKYEVQILDSFENDTYVDGQCASIYKTKPPLVNACRKPGEWQTYDIIFDAPVFEGDKVVKPGYFTVLQNGILVQNHTEILGSTNWDRAPSYEPHAERMPLSLQFHGNPVRFRNIWVRETPDIVGKK